MARPLNPDNALHGSQTLVRGLTVIEAVAAGAHDLKSLVAAVGMTRSTAHRLVLALVHLRYLRHVPGRGYFLGPKLIELGFKAHDQAHLPSLARPILERLAEACGDTVHLGILDGGEVLYIDKIQGSRGLEMRSRIGQRMPVASTGLGKALLLDQPETEWRRVFDPKSARTANSITSADEFVVRLRDYARRDCAFDLEENEPGIACVAVPIRGAKGDVVAAISVSSAVRYMSEARMAELVPQVQGAARAVSGEIGWSGAGLDFQGVSNDAA